MQGGHGRHVDSGGSHVLITGASRGIGAALAVRYAAPAMHLTLVARSVESLDAVAETCRSGGATASVRAADVRDQDAMAALVAGADAERPLSLVIANAGVAPQAAGLDPDVLGHLRPILATNLDGVINTALPAVAAMRPRRRGQIALVASLAGFFPLPGATAYCTAKAAVRTLGAGLRSDLAGDGVDVRVISPGFVETAMTAGSARLPFLMTPAQAAERIVEGLKGPKAEITFPWPLAVLVAAAARSPAGLRDRLVRTLLR